MDTAGWYRWCELAHSTQGAETPDEGMEFERAYIKSSEKGSITEPEAVLGERGGAEIVPLVGC